jgi:hypothetical protein
MVTPPSVNATVPVLPTPVVVDVSVTELFCADVKEGFRFELSVVVVAVAAIVVIVMLQLPMLPPLASF